MKKRLASLVIGLSVALSLAIPVGAAEMKTPVTEFESVTKEETIIHDVEFLSDATITTEDLGNDTYAIQLRNQEEPYINSESGESSSTTATIVAFGEEEFQEIEQSVQAAVSSASKKKESGWIYMGNSAYAEITINYNYKSSSRGTLYKMTRATVKALVRDGTSLKNRSVEFVSMMADYNGGRHKVSVPSGSSTYTAQAPSSWPYVSSNGLLYGVYFHFTAVRPGGSSQAYTFYNDLFG